MFEDLQNVKTVDIALNTKYTLMAMTWGEKFTRLFL